MEPLIIISIVLGVLVLGLIIAVSILGVKLSRKAEQKSAKADNVKVIDGVRYTTDSGEFTEYGGVAITHRKGDVVLERGQFRVVMKGGEIMPGKYTLLANSEGTKAFNLRVGGIVREFKHASDIVLAEGEEICAVSHSVILR